MQDAGNFGTGIDTLGLFAAYLHLYITLSFKEEGEKNEKEGKKQEEGSCRMQESRVLELTPRDCFGRTRNLEQAVRPTSSSGVQPRQTHASIVQAGFRPLPSQVCLSRLFSRNLYFA